MLLTAPRLQRLRDADRRSMADGAALAGEPRHSCGLLIVWFLAASFTRTVVFMRIMPIQATTLAAMSNEVQKQRLLCVHFRHLCYCHFTSSFPPGLCDLTYCLAAPYSQSEGGGVERQLRASLASVQVRPLSLSLCARFPPWCAGLRQLGRKKLTGSHCTLCSLFTAPS